MDAAFDLVITDQAMPHMTGLQLRTQLLGIQPALPVIIATGYAELPQETEPDLPRISKPFTQLELAAAVAANAPTEPKVAVARPVARR